VLTLEGPDKNFFCC